MSARTSPPNVILFNPRSSANAKPILPMSLLALGAVLENRVEYRIVDGNLEQDPGSALDALIRSLDGEVLLGVTVMPGPQLEQATAICRELKRRHPRLIVIWGGYFPTEHWQACLRSGFVDFVLRGHAEYSFAELIDRIRDGADPRGVAGLAMVVAGSEPVSEPMAPVPAPEELPQWNLAKVPMESYLRRTFLGARTIGYNSSYGCPFRCNFCAVVNLVDGRWLAQSPGRVAAAVERYRSGWGVDAVEMVDNNFFVHERRTREFAERIRDLGVSWWGEARVDTLLQYSDRTWMTMKESGLRMVFLGAESGSAETLERMDKGGRLTPEMTIELAQRMRSLGVVPEFSFVLGSPPDPVGDVECTLRFVRRLKKVNPDAEIILYLYTPVPLSGDLLDRAVEAGFRFPETLDEWVSPRWSDFSQRRSDGLPWIPAELRRKIRDFESVLAAYYPTTTDARLRGVWRAALRLLSGWRYRHEVYGFPLELRFLQRLMRYQRPEVSGF